MARLDADGPNDQQRYDRVEASRRVLGRTEEKRPSADA